MLVSYKGWVGIKCVFGILLVLIMVMFGFGSGLLFLLIVLQMLFMCLCDVGLDLGSIGLISLVSFFYLFKFLWVLLLDCYVFLLLGVFGCCCLWLLVLQVLVLVGLVVLVFVWLEEGVWLLVMWVLVVLFVGVIQDLVVDVYCIEIVLQIVQVVLVVIYMLGYWIGLILVGVGVLYLVQFEGWIVVYLVMVVLMLLLIVIILLCVELECLVMVVQCCIDIVEVFVQFIFSFFSCNGVVLVLVLLVFVGLFKFFDQVIGVMVGLFYFDLGFDKVDIVIVFKLFGVWMGIGGVFLGGIVVVVFGFWCMLLVVVLGVVMFNLVFLLMVYNLGKLWVFYVVFSVDNLFQGFVGIVLVVFMLLLIDCNFIVMQYVLLVLLVNLLGKFIGGVFGYIVEVMFYSMFFIFSLVIVVLILLLLVWLWSWIVDRGLLLVV